MNRRTAPLTSNYERDTILEDRTALKERNSPVIHVQQGMCSHGCGVRFDVNPDGTTREMWNGIVEFDARANSEQRDAALALNLGCFARLGGCKDIIDLLPTIWAHTGSEQISSRGWDLHKSWKSHTGLCRRTISDFLILVSRR